MLVNKKYNEAKLAKIKRNSKKISKNSYTKLKRKKNPLLYIALLSITCVTGLLLLTLFLPQNTTSNNPKDNRKQLEECQEEKVKNQKSLPEVYRQQIYCYSTYRVEESDEKITMFERYLTGYNQTNAASNAATQQNKNSQNQNYNDETSKNAIITLEAQRQYEEQRVENQRQYEEQKAERQRQYEENLAKNQREYEEAIQKIEEIRQEVLKKQAEEQAATAKAIKCNQYYAAYKQERSDVISSANTAISNASISCQAFGGCPAITNIERDRDQELARLKAQYKNLLESAECDLSNYPGL